MEVVKVDELMSFLLSIVFLLQNLVPLMIELHKFLGATNSIIASSAFDVHEALLNMDMIITSALHEFRLP